MFEGIKKFVGNLRTKASFAMVGFGNWAYNTLWTKSESLSLYEKSLYANKAITKRATSVAKTEFTLKDKGGNPVDSGEGLEWLKLLDRPNDNQTGDQFLYLMQKYYDIVGSAFILKKFNGLAYEGRRPNALEILRSDLVEVITNQEQTEILRFEYNIGGVVHKYLPEEIIYIPNPSPRNPLFGESLLASAVRSIDTEEQISQYHANVLRNGGKLESIFKVKNLSNQQQLDDMEARYKDKYATAVKGGRPLFMGGDIELVTTGLKPSELSFMETKLMTLDDIVIATSVPRILLAMGSKETFANADAGIAVYLKETIKPLVENLVNIFNWRLLPDEFTLGFVDPTPIDKEQKRKDIETADKVHALTTNEKREMLGLEPIKGGDDILVPFNLLPLGTEQEKKEETKKTTKGGDDLNASLKKLIKIKSGQTKKFKHPLSDKRFRNLYRKQKDSLMTQFEKRMFKAVDAYFKGQEKRLLERVEPETKQAIDDILNRSLEISIAKDELLPILRLIMEEQGIDTATTLGLNFSFSRQLEDSLQKRGILFTDSIISTTNEQLQAQFTESFALKETREQLVARINNLYSTISKGRAEVIARTEVHAGMQDTNLEVYKQNDIPIKIWVTVGDDRVRPEHKKLDGEEQPINAVFSNGLQKPSEPNCRCTI